MSFTVQSKSHRKELSKSARRILLAGGWGKGWLLNQVGYEDAERHIYGLRMQCSPLRWNLEPSLGCKVQLMLFVQGSAKGSELFLLP